MSRRKLTRSLAVIPLAGRSDMFFPGVPRPPAPGSQDVRLPIQHDWSFGRYVHGYQRHDVLLAVPRCSAASGKMSPESFEMSRLLSLQASIEPTQIAASDNPRLQKGVYGFSMSQAFALEFVCPDSKACRQAVLGQAPPKPVY